MNGLAGGSRLAAVNPSADMENVALARNGHLNVQTMSAFGGKADVGQPYLPQGGAWSRRLAMGRPQRHYNASGKTDLA
jgi:hypothetical protein